MSNHKHAFRCGDTVRHKPTGEAWTVAWCEDDTVAPAGWPDCRGRTADCEMIHAATDEEHAKCVAEWLEVKNDSRVGGVRRLYAVAQ